MSEPRLLSFDERAALIYDRMRARDELMLPAAMRILAEATAKETTITHVNVDGYNHYKVMPKEVTP